MNATWLICQYCGKLYKGTLSTLPHRCTDLDCMCTLSDFETYIPEEDGLLEKFRSKDWTIEEAAEVFKDNIKWAAIVFGDELRGLDREDFPIELLPLEEQEQERQERLDIRPCDICGKLTCFEGPMKYKGKTLHEGDRCDLCEQWVCQDCQDYAKECRKIDGEPVTNVCKQCGDRLDKEGGHSIE